MGAEMRVSKDIGEGAGKGMIVAGGAEVDRSVSVHAGVCVGKGCGCKHG